MYAYPPDRTFGTIIAVLSALCGCGVLAFTFFFGAFAAMVGIHATSNGAPPVFGAVAGLVFFVGILLASFYILGIIGGIGIASSKKWGFNLVLVLAIMRAILALGQLPHGLIGMVFDIGCIYYCYRRLSGAEGPRPI